MDIEKLIEWLRTESLYADKASLEIMDLCMDAATARSWRLDGQRLIAASGARTTTCFHPSTRQKHAADVGFATIKGFRS